MAFTKKQLLPIIGLVISAILLLILRFGEFELPFADDEDTNIPDKEQFEIIQDQQQQVQQETDGKRYSTTEDYQIIYRDPSVSSSFLHLIEVGDEYKKAKIAVEVCFRLLITCAPQTSIVTNQKPYHNYHCCFYP